MLAERCSRCSRRADQSLERTHGGPRRRVDAGAAARRAARRHARPRRATGPGAAASFIVRLPVAHARAGRDDARRTSRAARVRPPPCCRSTTTRIREQPRVILRAHGERRARRARRRGCARPVAHVASRHRLPRHRHAQLNGTISRGACARAPDSAMALVAVTGCGPGQRRRDASAADSIIIWSRPVEANPDPRNPRHGLRNRSV
jgi:hypothetical protein